MTRVKDKGLNQQYCERFRKQQHMYGLSRCRLREREEEVVHIFLDCLHFCTGRNNSRDGDGKHEGGGVLLDERVVEGDRRVCDNRRRASNGVGETWSGSQRSSLERQMLAHLSSPHSHRKYNHLSFSLFFFFSLWIERFARLVQIHPAAWIKP